MRLRLSVLSSLLLASLSAQADPGRVQFSATQSNFSVFDTDVMLPVWSNNNHMVYGDFAGGYGTNDTYMMSPGLGYRTIYNNQIFGGDLFADYERTSLSENFWVVSPGAEWMNAHWDAHVNGYFPLQSRQQNGTTDWADNYGIYEYGDPHGNSFDDARLTPYVVIGNGVDTEIGYSFDQGDDLRSRVFLGGYYYHPQDAYEVDNISGATAGFTKAVSKNFTVSLLNSYDNINRYMFGINLAVTLGGDSNEYSDNVEERMLDPVERHVGIMDTGAGTYDQQSYQVTGFGTEYNNVEYVSANANVDGVGTYEDPALLTQDNLTAFNEQFPDGALIYVQGGSNADYTVDNALSLYSGQDIYGRTTDYTAPAASDAQPQINAASTSDGFYIANGINTISDVTINGFGGSGNGVSVSGNSNVTLSNVNISGFSAGGNAGVYAYNDTDDPLVLNIINSSFTENQTGIVASNAANGEMAVNISNSFASYNTTNDLTFWNNINGGSTGTAFLTVNNSQFLNRGNTSGNSGIVIANASDGSITATIDNSTVSGNRSNGLEIVNNTDGGDGEGTGTGAGVIRITVNNSVFSHNGSYPDGEGPGVYIANNGPGTTDVNIYNSTISNNTLYGLWVDNLSSVSHSVMDINLAGTTFENNAGGYAIFGSANTGTSTTINYTDANFLGNTPTNQSDGDNITWIS